MPEPCFPKKMPRSVPRGENSRQATPGKRLQRIVLRNRRSRVESQHSEPRSQGNLTASKFSQGVSWVGPKVAQLNVNVAIRARLWLARDYLATHPFVEGTRSGINLVDP